jgi:hypothetical protein
MLSDTSPGLLDAVDGPSAGRSEAPLGPSTGESIEGVMASSDMASKAGPWPWPRPRWRGRGDTLSAPEYSLNTLSAGVQVEGVELAGPASGPLTSSPVPRKMAG